MWAQTVNVTNNLERQHGGFRNGSLFISNWHNIRAVLIRIPFYGQVRHRRQLWRLMLARPVRQNHHRTHLLLSFTPEAQTGGPFLVPIPVIRPGLVWLKFHHFQEHRSSKVQLKIFTHQRLFFRVDNSHVNIFFSSSSFSHEYCQTERECYASKKKRQIYFSDWARIFRVFAPWINTSTNPVARNGLRHSPIVTTWSPGYVSYHAALFDNILEGELF